MTEPDTQAEIIAFLADPATHGGMTVTRIDTHGAIVLLVANRAYKIKRAVTYPYLDFGTLTLRQAAIAKEFALNRKAAPSLYRGIGAVRRVNSALVFDENGDQPGEILEPVLVMRCFAQEDLLLTVCERQPERLTEALVDRLADAIIRFHRAADIVPVPDAAVRFGRVIDGIHVDMREIGGPFARDGATFADKARTQLRPLRELLNERGRSGAVLRGHGDLHLGNIVLLDGMPTLFDAIEFNDSFAVIDRLYDLAFLLMDLCRRGFVAAANRIFNRWCDAFQDEVALGFLPLALSTRAMVRASILPRQAQLAEDAATRARLSEQSFVTAAFAMRWLNRPAPRLLAVGGLSGTGKSRLAASLAPSLAPMPGARVLRSDVIRKSLHGVGPHETLPTEAYAKSESARVYRAMIESARVALVAGGPVILDAVFADPEERAAVEALAKETGIALTGLFLACDLGTRQARIAARDQGPKDASDATPTIAAAQEAYDVGPLGAWARLDAAVAAETLLAAAQHEIASATNG